MIKFDIQVNLPADALVKPATRTEHTVAMQAAKDTTIYVPSSGAAGGMSNQTKVVGGTIIYPGPYARFLYFGKLMVDPKTGSSWARKGESKVVKDKNLVFSKAVHPMPQAHWFEVSQANNQEKWNKTAKRAMKRELGK